MRVKLQYFKKCNLSSKLEMRELIESYLQYIEGEGFFFADMERKSFNGGYFEVPDLASKANVELLQKWNGNKSHTIKFIKL